MEYRVYKLIGLGEAVFFARPGKWVSEVPDAQMFSTKREAKAIAHNEGALVEEV